MTVRLDRRRPVESNIQKWNRLGEEMLSKPMTALEVVDELTYRNYAHNRSISPHITVARWARSYGPQTLEMEKRFVAENPNQPTPEEWQHLEYDHINRYAEE